MRKQKQANKSNTSIENSRNETRWICVLIIIHILLCTLYWSQTPFGLPPDEGPHGKYIMHIVEHHNLPIFDPNDKVNYESHQPPLYYLLGVPFCVLGVMFNLHDPASAARALSVIIGALSLVCVYLTVQEIFSNRRISRGSTAFVALLPQHVMLSSSVSNDILTELIFCGSLLLMVKQLKHGISWRNTIYIGILLGIGILTKTTCIMLIPTYIAAILITIVRRSASTAEIVKHSVAALIIALIVGIGWLIRNTILYGDMFGMRLFQTAFQNTAKPEYFLNRGLSILQYILMVAAWTFASFWGVFGHMNIFMPTWVYIILGLIFIIAMIMSIVDWVKKARQDGNIKDAGILCTVLFVLILVSFIRFNATFFQAQGRYLYPAIIPIAIVSCLSLIERISERSIYVIMGLLQILAIITIV